MFHIHKTLLTIFLTLYLIGGIGGVISMFSENKKGIDYSFYTTIIGFGGSLILTFFQPKNHDKV